MSKYRKATMSENIFERSLFILWVVSWFAACWIFSIQFFFTGLFAFILFVIHANGRVIKPKTVEEINEEQVKLTNQQLKKFLKSLEKETKKKRVKKK